MLASIGRPESLVSASAGPGGRGVHGPGLGGPRQARGALPGSTLPSGRRVVRPYAGAVLPRSSGGSPAPSPGGSRRVPAGSPGRDAGPGGLAGLARLLRTLPPSCGPVRLVAVDGHAGSGKSTLAGRLARELGGAPVLHLDDLADHDTLFGWSGRVLDQVVAPFSRGGPARHRVYDWERRRFGEARTLPPAPVVLVEGVGAGRRALRPHLAHLLWMDVPREEAWARGRLRDGPGLAGFWDGWERAEERHFAADPSRPYCDRLVRPCPEGYRVLSGPGGDGPGSAPVHAR